jgi:hypothetical protein
MARTTYEKEEDLRKEAEVAKILADYDRIMMVKMHMKYYIDFMGFTGQDSPPSPTSRAVSVTEIKCRDNSRTQYPTLIMSLAKWNMGTRYHEINGLDFNVAVKWTEGIFRYNYRPDNGYHIAMGGRKDRGDVQDIEPVIHIPVNDFVVVKYMG